MSGVDDDGTGDANVNAYSHVELRRLVDLSKIDTSIELFGGKWESPIFICPVGGQRKFHPEGELATARDRGAHGVIVSITATRHREAPPDARVFAGSSRSYRQRPVPRSG